MRGIVLALLALTAHVAHGQVRTYSVDGSQSRVTVAVERSGLFRFAGHTHEVVAPSMTGGATLNLDDLSRSEVHISFQAADLQVTGAGDPPEDVPKVQATMVGPRVLDAGRFPVITFRSDSATAKVRQDGGWDFDVVGDLRLHGVTKQTTLPLHIRLYGDTLTAEGTALLRQSDFGIKPISVGGMVKVKDEIVITYRIVSLLR